MADYSRYKYLKVEVDDKLARVTLNRPEKNNAFNRDFIQEMTAIWLDVGDDERVNAILVSAAGKYFSVGGDVKEMSVRPGGDFLKEGEVHDPAKSRRLLNNLLSIDKPIVCAIGGDAIGLAATIALFCDVTVMAETARIGDPHCRIGLVAGDGGAAVWPLLVGVSRAKEYLMLGSLIEGADAGRIGLVNYALPAEQVLLKANELATLLAQGATWAIRGTKLAVNLLLKQQLALTGETAKALEMETFHTADHMEATRAFAEKRKPQFTGR